MEFKYKVFKFEENKTKSIMLVACTNINIAHDTAKRRLGERYYNLKDPIIIGDVSYNNSKEIITNENPSVIILDNFKY